MFSILCDMFFRPGNGYSPMPIWIWNDTLDKDEITRQIDDFHKKGIDGFVIRPGMGMQVPGGYLSEEYFDMVEAALTAAKRRRMLVVLQDEGSSPSGSAHGLVVRSNPLFAARCLYVRPTGTYTLTPGEEVQMRMALQFDGDGKLTDVLTDEENVPSGYVWHDFILGFTGGIIRGLSPDETDGSPNAPAAADLLNPEATAAFLAFTHDGYFRRFGEDFGQTIVGMYTDGPSLTGMHADMNGKISWTYDFHEVFGQMGGDEKMLAALFFPPAEKRWLRDGQYILKKALGHAVRAAYYAPLADWCAKHKIALMGHPAASHDIGIEENLDIPGQALIRRVVEPGRELTAADSVLAKCGADMARHRGIPRNLCEVLGECGPADHPLDLTAAEMMWYLNFLFARGVSMIMPHAFYYSLESHLRWDNPSPDVGPGNIWWNEYRSLAGYIKRMSWLNAIGTNNPHAAVLCSEDEIPVQAVKGLYEAGYSFNYITMEQLEKEARILDGSIRLDRYVYTVLLVDPRLRLTPELVRIIGAFVTQGGKMHRGSNFAGFLEKNVPLTSYFDKQSPSVRFVHLTKSGYPFFLLVNEGTERIEGNLVTDQSGACRRFDPFTGKTEPVYAALHDNGLAYPVTLEPWSAVILGLDTDQLPELGKNPVPTLSEILALSPSRNVFSYTPAENRRCHVCMDTLRDKADVTVNGKPAGTILYRPYTLDITSLLQEGENRIEWTITGSIASTHGIPVETLAAGVRVQITDMV